jgi:DNA polymerase III alpha subunit (gram-positive type)
MNKYVALDLETGGIGHDKSLLTAYLAILDENMNVVEELDLKIKPNDDIYVLTAEALDINKIDIISHDKIAVSEKIAAQQVYNFLNATTNDGKNKLTPLGHNVQFDIQFLCNKTISKKSWDKFCTYRVLDTGVVAQFLIAQEVLPHMNASLGTLAQHYGITFEAHTAKGDTLATVAVMKRMLNK